VWVRQIQLQGFRNYDQLFHELQPGLNLFTGENGLGKTNLAEAIYLVATGESHRSALLAPLIGANRETAITSLSAIHGGRSLDLAVELNRHKSNRYFINGKVTKPVQMLGTLSSVIFAPEDLDLVRRDPSDRRSFLDQGISQLKPRLAAVKADYERVLKQRNTLLKSAKSVTNPDLGTLEIWDEKLVQLGAEILWEREQLIRALTPLLKVFYQALSNSEDEISLEIQSSIGPTTGELEEIAETFTNQLSQFRSEELERGITLVGPHRDELLISKAGLPTRTHSSQGEAWSIALGLKLGLGQLLREHSKTGDPVLILDDVFGVLDPGRRARLAEYVSSYEQVVVTAADPGLAPDLKWSSRAQVLPGGVIESEL
jgi:DNA replication and repair protein RecF